MKRQYFIPAFWATLTGLSLLLIAAMTDVKTPQALFISSNPPLRVHDSRPVASRSQSSLPVRTAERNLPESDSHISALKESPAANSGQKQSVSKPAVLTANAASASPQKKMRRSRILIEPGLELPNARARAVQFNLASDPKVIVKDPETSKMELRLVSLTKQVDRLTNLQIQSQQQSKLELAQNTDRLEQATKLLQQMQQMNQIRELERKLDGLQQKPATSRTTTEKKTEAQNTETPQKKSTKETVQKKKSPLLKVSPNHDSAETFSLQIQDAEILQVLDMLGELSGKNILSGQGVIGTVTANLKNVTAEQALEAILRSHNLASEKEGDFIYVMTPAEWEQKKKSNRKVITKLYSPFYISAKELQNLITPLLTENIGLVSLTTPSEIGITPDPTSAGGDTLAQNDSILVRDYPEILEEVDKLLEKIDVPPMQVVIEAMIISVLLNDDMRFGVNFAVLGGNNKNLLVDGNGQLLNNSSGFPGPGSGDIVPPTGQFIADLAGLKYGFLRGDISGFIEALEDITETNLIASPQLRALNKQKAELIIGDRISYSTVTQNGNTSIQNVNFLDSGIVLNLRPFITPDGQIRMEIHPERSSATINTATNLPDLQTTEVTTNVMVRDGSTVVIGGLIEERASDTKNQVPFLGAIPVIGNAFRLQRETMRRTELIILITPRIVQAQQAEAEGATEKYDGEERLDTFKENFLPINQIRIVQMHIKKAKKYLKIGNLPKAKEHIKIAVRLDKNNLEAIQLQNYIQEALKNRNRRLIGLPPAQSSDEYVPSLEGDP